MLKRNLQYVIINIAIILLLVYGFAPALTLHHLINVTFYVLAFYMLISLAAYTIKGGFYDGIAFGLRRSRHILSRHRESQQEEHDKQKPSEKVNPAAYKTMWFQSLSLLGLLIIFLIIYNMI